MLREDLGVPQDIEVWEENWDALSVFSAMRTQWNTGMGGPTGLKYEVIPTVTMMLELDNDDRPDLFRKLQVMEGFALKTIAAQMKQK